MSMIKNLLNKLYDLRANVLEIFLLSNIAFIGLDIWLAHSYNDFAKDAEWIPIGFSALAGLLLGVSGLKVRFDPTKGLFRILGLVLGALAVIVGVAGFLFHINSGFLQTFAIRELAYSAPLVAPLAYAGVGLLLIMNRMVKADGVEWCRWLLFFSVGGFVGNLMLALADHAQNGFFHWTEWIPVISASLVIGALLTAFFKKSPMANAKLMYAMLFLQIVVGHLGFAFHLMANLEHSQGFELDKFIFGAPVFAPMLFVNLAILGLLGVWVMDRMEQSKND